MKKNYNMTTVNAYLEMVDKKTESSKKQIKSAAERYLNKMSKADINAELLEKLLA